MQPSQHGQRQGQARPTGQQPLRMGKGDLHWFVIPFEPTVLSFQTVSRCTGRTEAPNAVFKITLPPANLHCQVHYKGQITKD